MEKFKYLVRFYLCTCFPISDVGWVLGILCPSQKLQLQKIQKTRHQSVHLLGNVNWDFQRAKSWVLRWFIWEIFPSFVTEKGQGPTDPWEVQVALLLLVHCLSVDGKRNWSRGKNDLRVWRGEQKVIIDDIVLELGFQRLVHNGSTLEHFKNSDCQTLHSICLFNGHLMIPKQPKEKLC